MIKFRQKEFFWGAALNIGMLGTSVVGLKQGADAQKASEEQTEAMMESNKKMTSALNKIAENAKANPQVANAAHEVMKYKAMSNTRLDGRIRLFAVPSVYTQGFVKNMKGLGKDLFGIVKNNKKTLIGGVTSGAGIAGASYLANKYVERDLKKSGVDIGRASRDAIVQKNQQNLVAHTQQISYSEVANSVVKKKGRFGGKLLGPGMSLAFGAGPTMSSYYGEKKQLIDQLKQTQQGSGMLKPQGSSIMQRSYGVPGAGLFSKFKAAPVKTTLSGLSSFMGGGGSKGVANVGRALQNSSNSTYSRALGNFIRNNEKTALAGSVVLGAGIMSTTFGQGEKLTKKALNAVDKNAYAYDKYKQATIN